MKNWAKKWLNEHDYLKFIFSYIHVKRLNDGTSEL